MKILVTGASGFIGQTLCGFLANKDYPVTAIVRRLDGKEVERRRLIEYIAVEDILEFSDWSKIMKSVDCIVHLAATAHRLDCSSEQLEEAFNRDKAVVKLLAQHAKEANVRRFVFLSSVKVYGEPFLNKDDHVYDEKSEIGINCDQYGLSKIACENLLINATAQTPMSHVIIRPPLVYGNGVKANFRRLLKLSNTVLPLPFAKLDNRRSLISVDNLVDFILCCCGSPQADNQIFLVSDNNDLSITELVATMRESMGRKARLFYFPYVLLKELARMLGKQAEFDKLCGSFQISIDKAMSQLNWQPTITPHQAINNATKAYLREDQ